MSGEALFVSILLANPGLAKDVLLYLSSGITGHCITPY